MPAFSAVDSFFFTGAALVAGVVVDFVVLVANVVGPVRLGCTVGVAVGARPWTPMMVWTSPTPMLRTPVPSEQLQLPACWSDAQQNVLLPQGSRTASVVFSSCDRRQLSAFVEDFAASTTDQAVFAAYGIHPFWIRACPADGRADWRSHVGS
jgi:hypothetical protein